MHILLVVAQLQSGLDDLDVMAVTPYGTHIDGAQHGVHEA